jgi:hypothetical protein
MSPPINGAAGDYVPRRRIAVVSGRAEGRS